MIYLFTTPIDCRNVNLTGAHRRFKELVNSISRIDQVILISPESSEIDLTNVTWYPISNKKRFFLPNHISGMINMYCGLRKVKKKLKYDFAVSFSPTTTICYHWLGIHSIVSLFRENLIEYLKTIKVSKLKLMYFKWQEILAVKYSQKIIVQCKNDKKNLIERNKKYCIDIDKKISVQINNANASWMKKNILRKNKENEATQILFIGNFSDCRKGHGILLPAVTQIINEGYSINLLIAGDGIEKEMYEEKYSKYSEIKFLGRVNNMEPYLSSVDFLIVPSLIDSCPNTVLEGLNAGVAVYGANAGGIPDLLENMQYMFEPSTESIYSFLKDVLDSKRFVLDAEKQIEIRNKLTFDWGMKIKRLME